MLPHILVTYFPYTQDCNVLIEANKMSTNRLIKFRPLANDNGPTSDFERAKTIIETGKFWCQKLWGLNDPMEGVYRTSNSSKQIMDTVFSKKNKYAICSFSHPDALKCPLLWGHYANGFKGIAIEIEVADYTNIQEIDYIDDVREVDDSQAPDIKKIITTKLNFWQYENEYRYLKPGKADNYEIGEIIKVYFGTPYGNIENYEQALKESTTLQDYDCCRKHLKDVCIEKNIDFIDFKLDVKPGQMIRWLNHIVKTENDVAVANTRAEIAENRSEASGI